MIIHRNWEDVARSMAKIDLPHEIGYFPEYAKRLNELDGLHVEFSDINERLEEIHNYLGLPGYSKEGAELFTNMNIQSLEWGE